MPATDEQLAEAYERLRSVQKVGRECDVHPSTVHRRLQLLSLIPARNFFTDEERERLKAEYALYRDHGRLQELADAMGRSKTCIVRQARRLGLTDQNRPRMQLGTWKYMTEPAARILFDEFKASPLGVMQWCAKNGYDDEGFRGVCVRYWPDEWEPVVESKAPQSTWYRLGRRVEYRVRDVLKELGYFVMRSPASKTPIDIMAVRTGAVLMVQCKRSGVLPPKEWNELHDLAESVGAVPLMAETPWPRELRFWRLTARKDGSRRRQPMVRYDAAQAADMEGQAAP